jgi:hypothetical protein
VGNEKISGIPWKSHYLKPNDPVALL